MTVRIDINGEQIQAIEVVNRGPVGGADGKSYDGGDHEGGDGLCRYDWRRADGSTGVVVHRRGDGAVRLAEAVCESVADGATG